MTLKPGWLVETFARNRREIETWPLWMRRAAGLPSLGIREDEPMTDGRAVLIVTLTSARTAVRLLQMEDNRVIGDIRIGVDHWPEVAAKVDSLLAGLRIQAEADMVAEKAFNREEGEQS